MANEIKVGDKLKVVKGSKNLDLPKGVSLRVTEITPMGADYSYSVKVRIQTLNGFGAGSFRTIYARHMNRLSDDVVALSGTMPSDRIQLVRV
jgi:hypothetical protein